MMFGNRSVVVHLLRGAIGFGAVWSSLATMHESPVLSFALVGVAFVALRGCPVCWTIGFFETLAVRLLATRDQPQRGRSDSPLFRLDEPAPPIRRGSRAGTSCC
jgi:hypothetical protein